MRIQYKLGYCSSPYDNCPNRHTQVPIVKKLSSGNYCKNCNDKRLGDSREAQGKTRSWKHKKPTGEILLFESIWNTRRHESFLNKEPLGDSLDVKFFAHVLPKAQNKYPKFKLYDKNIVLLTWDQHHFWDNGIRSDLMKLPEWSKLFDLEAELKKEYEMLERGEHE